MADRPTFTIEAGLYRFRLVPVGLHGFSVRVMRADDPQERAVSMGRFVDYWAASKAVKSFIDGRIERRRRSEKKFT